MDGRRVYGYAVTSVPRRASVPPWKDGHENRLGFRLGVVLPGTRRRQLTMSTRSRSVHDIGGDRGLHQMRIKASVSGSALAFIVIAFIALGLAMDWIRWGECLTCHPSSKLACSLLE